MSDIKRQQLVIQEDNSVIIGSLSAKGGTGKTSLLTNLAGVAHIAGKKQLLIDLDGQSNIRTTFDLKPGRYGVEAVFTNKAMPTRDLITSYKRDFDIIQSSKKMHSLELELIPNMAKMTDPFGFIHDRLEVIRHQYDYVWIDTPPHLGLTVGNALKATEYVIIPYVPEPYAEEGLADLIETVKQFQSVGNNVQVLAVVPMFVVANTNLHTRMLQKAQQFCLENDIYITETVIPRSIRFPESVEIEKQPATMGKIKENDHAVKAYFKLWGEIENELKSSQLRSEAAGTGTGS